MRLRAVVFDWYRTLCAPNPDDFWDRLPELITEAGGRPDVDALGSWNLEHPSEHREHSATEETYRRWQRTRLHEAFLECDLEETALANLLDRIEAERYSRLFEVFPDVPKGLGELRAAGLILGVCSNWDWDLHRHLEHNRVHDLFDFVLTSAAVGYRKPHRAMFDLVLDAVTGAAPGTSPNCIGFIGDTWSDDIAGAAEAGMQPFHIARFGSCRREDHGDVVCVADLSELASLLLR